MKPSDRASVSKRIKHTVRENELKNYIEYLAIIRNVCAHSERLYSYRSSKDIKSNYIRSYFTTCSTTNDFFNVLIGLKLTLEKNEFEQYFTTINEMILYLDRQLHTININEITDKMGFPLNWRDIKNL